VSKVLGMGVAVGVVGVEVLVVVAVWMLGMSAALLVSGFLHPRTLLTLGRYRRP
jgi:hypothetical protein